MKVKKQNNTDKTNIGITKKNIKNKKGITLIALVITIIILLIFAGISIAELNKNGILGKAQIAKEENQKQTATETINLKITNIQILSYSEKQELPNLQYLADQLCEDNDIEYVIKESKKQASLNKIDVSNSNSIFTKLKSYPYEFEINSQLQLASIDGIKVSNNTNNTNNNNKSDLVGEPNITVKEVESTVVKISADIGDSNKKDIAGYVFFNADTSEILKIQEDIDNLEVNNLVRKTQYNIYMKILDKYGNFSESSNVVTFTTKGLGNINITYAQGYSHSINSNITDNVRKYLFDGIKEKQGSYGAYMMANQVSSYMTFDIKDGDMFITFCSNSYGDSGGNSGKTFDIYKLNSNNEYKLYTSIEQQNNNHEYSKTYFTEGNYKLTFTQNYVEFDEWIISED